MFQLKGTHKSTYCVEYWISFMTMAISTFLLKNTLLSALLSWMFWNNHTAPIFLAPCWNLWRQPSQSWHLRLQKPIILIRYFQLYIHLCLNCFFIKHTRSMFNKNKPELINSCIYTDLIFLHDAQRINSYEFSSACISL